MDITMFDLTSNTQKQNSLKIREHLRYGIISTIFCVGVLGVYANLGLFADGSYFLLSILTSRTFFDFYTTREFAQMITQVPVLIAIKLGMTHLNTLIHLHSLGVIGVPLGFWIAALFKQFKTDLFWLFVIAFNACYLSSGFFAIGEYNVTYAMVALSGSILLNDQRYKKIDYAGLLFLASFLTLSYESMCYLGPLLSALTLIRFWLTDKTSLLLKNTLILVAILFVVGSIISVYSILSPQNPTSLLRALMGTAFVLGSMQLLYLLMILFLFITYLYFEKKICLFFAGFISITHIINVHFWNPPGMNYHFRIFSGLILFVIISTASVYHFTYQPRARKLLNEKIPYLRHSRAIKIHSKFCDLFDKTRQCKPTAFAGLCFASLMIPFYIEIIGFYTWASRYEQVVITQKGFISVDEAKLSNSRYHWGWTNPCLSILLRGNKPGAVILNSQNHHGWQPFNPFTTEDDRLSFFKKDTNVYKETPDLFKFLT